jgi:hypothetical protein
LCGLIGGALLACADGARASDREHARRDGAPCSAARAFCY